jgi:hypothetical protein
MKTAYSIVPVSFVRTISVALATRRLTSSSLPSRITSLAVPHISSDAVDIRRR